MSLAEEMLATMSASDESVSYLADEEPHIIIDGTRKIIVPNALKLIAVQGDKDIETVTFDCVRYWDGNDLSSFAIYINYILPNKAEGTYIPQNVTRFDDIFSFEWKIGKEITHTKGSLTFWIVAKLTNDDADVIKQWSSLQNSECTIAQGGDKTYVPESQTDKDVISQVLSVSQASALRAEEAAISAENRYELVQHLTGSVVELSGNALRDAKRAEAAAEQSALKADSSLLSAQNALQSERAAMEYESQARSSAESAARAATHAEAVVAGVNEKIERNSKRLTNLEQGLPSEQFMTDSTVAHVQDVPVNALPFAEVSKVGGMTRKCTNLWDEEWYNASLNENTGVFTEAPTADVSSKNFISVLPNTEYYKSVSAWVAFYDNSKAFISASSNSAGVLTTPNDCYFMKFQTLVGNYGTVYKNDIIISEGSTALPYEPYYEGLRDAKVTEMKSVGVNLIPAFNIGIGINDSTGEIGTNSSKACTDFIQINPNESYMWSGIVKTLTSCVYFYNAQKEYMGRCGSSSRDSLLVTKALLTLNLTNVGGEISYIRLWQSENVNLTGTIDMVDNSNQMLSKGSTALPYTPYVERTLPIPEAVQALDGYGWGINADCYNYIDWEKKQFVKRVGVVDMGMISWSDTAYPYTFRSGVENLKAPDIAIERATGFIITKYPPSSNVNYTNIDDKSAIRYQANILVRDSDYADAATFKSAMQGVMLVYELETPIITDISDLLSADNFLAVEGGGTVTAVNEYGYDVPSEITYMLKETTV